MKKGIKIPVTATLLLFAVSCVEPYYKNDYEDNTPTSGKLKVFYDEGLELHVKNQVFTFCSQYDRARIEPFCVSEDEAVEAMYKDSCKAIMIARPLNEKELKAFASKQINPRFSVVAYDGLAVIGGKTLNVHSLTIEEIVSLLSSSNEISDSTGQKIKVNVLLDKKNSGISHYLKDSVVKGKPFAAHCGMLGSTYEAIRFVSSHPNSIAFIDFSWLSDVDDTLFRSQSANIRFIGIRKGDQVSYPDQSSFKTGEYPFIRPVYIYRRTGDFTLAKGFESFVAGPKGQMTFLKQGLLPSKQQERNVEVKFEPVAGQ